MDDRIDIRIAALAMCLIAGQASAQTAEPAADPPAQTPTTPTTAPIDPADDPGLRDASLDDVADGLSTRHDNPVAISPVVQPTSDPIRSAEPGGGRMPGVPKGRLLPEGTFVGRQGGIMIQVPTGEWIFVFQREESGKQLPPMVMLPSQTLSRMESVVEGSGSPAIIVSGEVFVYRGRNFLLPTVFGSAPLIEPTEDTNEPDQPDDQLADVPPIDPTDPLAVDPRVEALIADITTRQGVPRGLAPAEDLDDGAEAATPEGSFLLRRHGRMTRLTGGEWAVVFDNDHRTDSRVDPPAVLLPCKMMERLEHIADEFGDDRPIEFTGRVYRYKGRMYALATLFRVYPPSELNSLQ